MKQIYTKVLLLFTCLLCGMSAIAADFVVDGISYLKDSETDVSVTTGTYSGEITIPESITVDGVTYTVSKINSSAFKYTTEVTAVTLPNTITELPDRAFDGCSALTTVNLPSNLTSIGAYCFRNCSVLATIDIPASVKTIGDQAFNGCRNFPNRISINAETVGSLAFNGCKIYYLTLGENVKSLSDAFANCSIFGININTPTPPTIAPFSSSSRDVYIETHIHLAGEWVETYKQADVWKDFFYIVADWDTAKATLINGIYYNFLTENTAEVVAGENAYSGAITIPATIEHEGNTYNVTAIRSEAFYNSKIKSVTLPEGIEKIGVGAFYGCQSLTSIVFPNSLTTLESYAFGTSAIENITWGTGLTALNGLTFVKADGIIRSYQFTIPATITSMSYGDFGGWFYFRGTTVTMESATPPTVDSGVFDGIISWFSEYADRATLIIPAGSTEAYTATSPWNEFGTIIEQETTGIEAVETSDSDIIVNGNTISTNSGSDIAVFDIYGRLIYAGENNLVTVPAGTYIVKVSNACHKVVIK